MNEKEILAKSKFIIGLRDSLSRQCERLYGELILIDREDLAKKITAINVTANEAMDQIHQIHELKGQSNEQD